MSSRSCSCTFLSIFLFSFFPILLPRTASFSRAPPVLRHRFLKPPSPHSTPQEYLQVSRPLLTDFLIPSCTHLILNHSFANTILLPPFTTPYAFPSLCPPPWSRVVLSLSAWSSGDQYDRISALWLGGVELLRTSTPEPNPRGIFWNVRKDITPYSSLLQRSDLNVSMMLENIVTDDLTGVYNVSVTFLFYNDVDAVRAPLILKLGRRVEGMEGGFWSRPADVIIPISNGEGGETHGFWFRVDSEKDVLSKSIAIPCNTARAVLEVYLSFHGDDEFWYSNPPDSYITENNLTTGRGHGAHREVFILIDGLQVTSIFPFPVIFAGGINPLFWEPVVAIKAFDLPSYKIELTPVLATILDGKEHEFAIGVSDGISYWLVDANLHLWLDRSSHAVAAGSVVFKNMGGLVEHVKQKSVFKGLNGSFAVEVKMREKYGGWVNTSLSNLTTIVSARYKLKNSVKFTCNGTYKVVKQKMKGRYQIVVMNDLGVPILLEAVKRKYPLRVITSTLPGKTDDTYVLITNVSHAMKEKVSGVDYRRLIANKQDSTGWMEVRDHNVLSGAANTTQSYRYRDEFMCYSRHIEACNGSLVADESALSCE